MLRLTLKNLKANRVRFAMTTFAVVLAVSFVVSSFVLTDGLRSTFGDLSADIVDGTDLEVRPIQVFGETNVVDDATLDAVRDIDGVRAAAPLYEAEEMSVQPIKADGTTIDTAGPPQLAFGWVDDTQISSFSLVDGAAPGPDEFTMDLDSAADNDFVIGETYEVVTPTGVHPMTFTGTTSFGENNDTVGAVLMQFDVATLLEVTGESAYDSVAVALDDTADLSTVQRAIGTEVAGVEVVDNATLESEQAADFNSSIDIIGNVLLGFAAVSLFVSVFIIYNTFSIVLGQRTKELALLRTVGADPVQLRRSVQAEAIVIGILASAIGIVAGVGVAFGLRGIFEAIGASLPDSPTILSLRTIIVACLVGIVVTFIAAVGPARKAAKVPAIAALRDGADAQPEQQRRSVLIGAGLTLVGIVAGGIGLFGGVATAAMVGLLGVGAIGIFTGITLLSPVFAGWLTSVLGWPVRSTMGVAGRLAQENAGRNPRRTSTTAAALMVGLALVTMALVVGESVKAQLRSTLNSSVDAEYLITEEGEAGLPAELATLVADSAATEQVVAWNYADVKVTGSDGEEIIEVVAADHGAVDALFDLGISDGTGVSTDVVNPVLVADYEAEALGLSIGDTFDVEFASGITEQATVTGVFTDDVIVEEKYVFDISTFESAAADGTIYWMALTIADGVDDAQLAAAFGEFAEFYPLATVETFVEFVDGVEGDIDAILTALNAMVALAVVIALIGIANTLALSVFERTRELGLLRAVGMTRRQLRRMIRFEAGLVALFGAVLGVGIGIGFGWAAVAALPAEFTSTLAIPVSRIVILVAVAGVAGLIAARGPAKRAGKLDVLDAIANG